MQHFTPVNQCNARSQPTLWVLAALIILFPPRLIQGKFVEELMLQPQPDGTILAHFDFGQEFSGCGDALPTKIRSLLDKHPVQELKLAFVLGRWFAEKWSLPPITVDPPGANLRVAFFPLSPGVSLQQEWGNLTHTLSGLFCASLNFLADTSMVAMPGHAFEQRRGNTDAASPWLYGSLPREAVCTENLTPWLKLLPCQGRQGLTQLLDRPTLYGASFHSMQIHLTVNRPVDSQCDMPDTGERSCSWSSNGTAQQHSPAVTLQQTLTLVIRSNQLHGDHPAKTSYGWGPPIQPDLDLKSLFNVPGVAACSKAAHTHIYWQLPRHLLSHVLPSSRALNASATQNSLYSFSPTPDAVITSLESLFAVYNLTAGSSNQQGQGQDSQQCLQPSLTWHQQPPSWLPSRTPVKAQQSVTGRLGDRGTLVLQVGFDALAQQLTQAQNSSLLQMDGQPVCMFQMVPWHFQLAFHTLRLQIDGKKTSLASAVVAHKLEAAEGPGTTALIELCLRIPSAAQSLVLSIAFQKAFLSVFDHPPDAYRGFDMPAALVTNPQAQPLHQAPWTILQQEHADPSASKLQSHSILQHLSMFTGSHVYTKGVPVLMPTPDFSMPYNVCCLSCTVLALYVLGINSAVFGKPEGEEATVRQKKIAKIKQLVSVLLLVLVCGGLAVSTDKKLQRQLHAILGISPE